jgi:polar amino acid transport system substrate-binding protein
MRVDFCRLRRESCCVFYAGAITGCAFLLGAGICMDLQKDRRDVRRLLNDGLRRVAARGRYAEIYLKYFPVSFF